MYLLQAADGSCLAHLGAINTIHAPVHAEVGTAHYNVCGHLAFIET